MGDRPEWALPNSELCLTKLLKGKSYKNLENSFIWSKTPEKDQYWLEIYRGQQKITPQIHYRLYQMRRELLELSKDG